MDLSRGRLFAADVPRRDGVWIQLRAALARIRWIRRQPLRQNPVDGDTLGHRKTLLRVVDRRLQRFFEGEGAEASLHFIPAPGGAGHRYEQNAALRHSGTRTPVLCVPGVTE